MGLYKQKLNCRTGQFNLVPSAAVLIFKEGVDTEASLPSEGNTQNDARITADTGHLYVWDGSAWIDQGDIIDITEVGPMTDDLDMNNHSILNVKVDSIHFKDGGSITKDEYEDAVNKAHTQNTDTKIKYDTEGEILSKEQLVETSPMTAFGTSYGFSGFNDICEKICQTFVAEASGTVSKITCKFAQNGCTGNLIVSIQPVDGSGHPTGVILDSISLSAAQIPLEGTEHMFPMIFNGTATLVEGTKYAIVFDPSGMDYDIDKYLYWYESIGIVDLTGGEYLGYYSGDWLNWYALQETGLTMLSGITPATKVDMMFQVYVNATILEDLTANDIAAKLHEQNTDTTLKYQIPDIQLDQEQNNALGQQWNCKEWEPPYQFCPLTQTFKAEISGRLVRFGINGGLGGGGGTITMQIQATTDGKPNGTVIEQVDFNPDNFITDDWTYISFSTATLVAGTTYAFVMSFDDFTPGDWGPNLNRYNSDDTDIYTDGQFLIYIDSTWDTDKNQGFVPSTNYSDMMFRTYIDTGEGTFTESIKDGFVKPISSADADAPNNSIYYSTDQTALVYKDSIGTVHTLY